MGEKTVTINGMIYDRRTGMPLRIERGHDEPRNHAAQRVHSSVQRSRTLNRKYVAKQAAPAPSSTPTPPNAVSTHKTVATPLVTRSESISRFAKEFNAKKHAPSGVINDIGPTTHPIARIAHERTAQATTPAVPVVKPSQVLKQEAIADAMSRVEPAHAKQIAIKQSSSNRYARALSVASGALAVLVLGGYLTYLSMPNLSTRVAAAQAGINASYPGYHPSGYSLSGPVAFNQGDVTMKFAANAGPQNYTLDQTRSGWDSSAVLDNYVTPKVGSQYTTSTTNGLTIYTYGTNAAWVNGGILYTISGNAPLSGEQIQRIATSL